MVRTLIGAVALAAIAVVGCSGSTATSTTTTTTATTTTNTTVVSGDVIFGSGTIPETVPDAFPFPNGVAIGDTLQDTRSGRTEVVVVVAGDPRAVADYYEENLPDTGFAIGESGAQGASHVITFTGHGVDGEIVIGVGSVSTTTVALTIVPVA